MKKIIITPESYPQNPREDYNLGTMVCFHKRYDLGDNDHGLNQNDFESWGQLEEFLYKERNAFISLPLSLYDHSGISISIGKQGGWDSVMVGFIYIKEDVELNQEWLDKHHEGDHIKALRAILEGEVETYDQYLRGDVYKFRIVQEVEMVSMTKSDWEKNNCDNVEHFIEDVEIDSCGGFYGTDWFKNGMSDYIPEELHELLKTTEITYE